MLFNVYLWLRCIFSSSLIFFVKQKTAYEMRISDWSSDVCSSDLPRGEITTTRDPDGRTTVFDRLPPELGRLQAVGRPDINSEGLLLLTNDGALKRQLELPSSGWLSRYRVSGHGRGVPERLAALAKGVTVESIAYGPLEAPHDHQHRHKHRPN